jgi:hypothetical protein
VSTFKVGSTFTFKIPITNYQKDGNSVKNFDFEEEIKDIHPNQSIERGNYVSSFSFGEELSKDINELIDDQQNSLFKQLISLKQISYNN